MGNTPKKPAVKKKKPAKKSTRQVNARHKKILAFIKVSREAFPSAAMVYTWGGCYGFHKMLKQVFPDAVPFMTKEPSHVVTKIGTRYYDINGEYVYLYGGEIADEMVPFTAAHYERWDSVALGQTLERIIARERGRSSEISRKGED